MAVWERLWGKWWEVIEKIGKNINKMRRVLGGIIKVYSEETTLLEGSKGERARISRGENERNKRAVSWK